MKSCGDWSWKKVDELGWLPTVASQVDGDDECSTGQWWVLCLHNGGDVKKWLAVTNLRHVVLAESPRLSLGNCPTRQECHGTLWRTRVEKTWGNVEHSASKMKGWKESKSPGDWSSGLQVKDGSSVPGFRSYIAQYHLTLM